MKVKLQDGTEVDVNQELFARDCKKSDKIQAKVITNEYGESQYTFDTEEYGEVVILSSKFLN